MSNQLPADTDHRGNDSTINRLIYHLTQIKEERDITPTAVGHLAAFLSAGSLTKARATEIHSCGRVSFGRERRYMNGIAIFVPADATGIVAADRAAIFGADGDDRDVPWRNPPFDDDWVWEDILDPRDAASIAIGAFEQAQNASDSSVPITAVDWNLTPLIAILGYASRRSSLPDVAIWDGELTQTGRVCFGRDREGEDGLAIFTPECELWGAAVDPIIRAIETPWW